MANSIFGPKASFRVPAQTTSDKVDEHFVVTLQNLLQCLGRRPTSTPLGRDTQPGLAHRVKEELLSRALLDQMLLWRTKYFHDAGQLLLLIFTGENRHPGV